MKKYYTNWFQVTLFILTIMAFVSVAYSSEDHPQNANPFEPTITKEENRIIQRVMEMAETNTTAALNLLESKEKSNTSPVFDFVRGNIHFQNNELEKAAAAYQDALKKQPLFRSALVNLGRIYLLQERTNDAIELYKELVSSGQADADSLMLLGHALMIEDYPVSAENAYRQSLLLAPKNEEAMTGLAKSLFRQERYKEALALVHELLKTTPANQELWSLRMNAHLSEGDYEAAIISIESAHRMHCADSEMLATLGDLYLNENQPDDAARAYQAAFDTGELEPARTIRAARGFIQVGDISRAEEIIRQIEPDKEDGLKQTVLKLKAQIAGLQGQSEMAEDLFYAILKQNPLDGETILQLARIKENKNQLEEAVLLCEQAARVEGFEADALIRQAQIEVQRERYTRAVELLEAAQAFEQREYVARYLEQIRRLAD